MEQEKKSEQKVVKLCPFISGFMLEPAKDKLGNQIIGKTTNVAPCITNKCVFYDEQKSICKILLGIEYLSLIDDLTPVNFDDSDDTEEGVDNE